jgi:pyridoxamine 5'-phosphate oxidase
VFYTNTESRKAEELAANPRAAVVFNWPAITRQVRVEGRVERVGEDEADAYFATRARASQIGAWASDQSRPLEGRFALERRVAQFTAKFGLGKIPRPPHWTGYRVVPDSIEFWRQQAFRLHDRVRYVRSGTGWTVERLYP